MSSDFRLGMISCVGRDQFSFYRPLGLGYLVAYLKKRADFGGAVIEQEMGGLIANKPGVVGISSTTLDMNLARRYAQQARRELRAPIVLGGVHITTLPESLPEEFDIGIIGEGEETLRELVELFRKKGGFPPSELAGIAGICYRENGQVRLTGPRALIEDLDTIPHPDLEAIGYQGGPTYMFTSRGCPYDCRFCASRLHWGKRFRRFSARYVVEEIAGLVEGYHTDNIHFFDDIFVADRPRLEEIVRLVREKGLEKKVEFSCAIRAEAADESLIETLRAMNVVRVTFGAESNSPRVLSYLKRAQAAPEANQQAVDLCRRRGVKVGLSFIKGAPVETLSDVFSTYDFILQNIRARNIDMADVNDLVPFPGTEIWDVAKSRGLVSENMDWDELKQPWKKQYLADLIPKELYLATDLLTQRVIRSLKLARKKLLCILLVPPLTSEALEARTLETVRAIQESRFFDRLLPVAATPDAEAAAQKITSLCGLASGAPGDMPSYDVISLVHAGEEASIQDLLCLVWHHLEQGADYSAPAETTLPAEKTPAVFSAKAFKRLMAARSANPPGVEPTAKTLRRLGLSMSLYRASQDPFRPTSASEKLYRSDLQRASKGGVRGTLRWLAQLARRKG